MKTYNILKTVAAIYYSFENSCLLRASVCQGFNDKQMLEKHIKITHSEHFTELPLTNVKKTVTRPNDSAIAQNKHKPLEIHLGRRQYSIIVDFQDSEHIQGLKDLKMSLEATHQLIIESNVITNIPYFDETILIILEALQNDICVASNGCPLIGATVIDKRTRKTRKILF